MTNSSKAKGDKAEREAIAYLRELVPDLLVPGADRAFAAGIPQDRGDLYALDDTTIQVKAYAASAFGQAILGAAAGAEIQAVNAHKPFSLGMALIPRAPKAGVRWAATFTEAASASYGFEPVADFRTISKLRGWLTDDTGPDGYLAHPRAERVARFIVNGRTTVACPMEAWEAAYRRLRAAPKVIPAA